MGTANFHTLDPREALDFIQHERKRKQTFAVLGVIIVALILIAATVLMYDATPADQPAGRIGTNAMESVAPD